METLIDFLFTLTLVAVVVYVLPYNIGIVLLFALLLTFPKIRLAG